MKGKTKREKEKRKKKEKNKDGSEGTMNGAHKERADCHHVSVECGRFRETDHGCCLGLCSSW